MPYGQHWLRGGGVCYRPLAISVTLTTGKVMQNRENSVVLGDFHDRVAGSTLLNHRHASSINTHDRDARSPERHHGDSTWTSMHHRHARSISTHDRDARSPKRHHGDSDWTSKHHRDARLPKKNHGHPHTSNSDLGDASSFF